MQIDTGYNLPLLPTTSSQTTGTTSGPSTSTATASLFGPAALLSLGQSTPVASSYANLLVPLPSVGTLPIVWQFDLSSVYNPPTAALTAPPRSPDQQKAENAAVKEAFDLINAGQQNQARELMNNLLAKNQTNAAAVQALGYAAQADRDYARAEQLFRKAHVLDPTAGYDQDAENARTLQGDDEVVYHRAAAMVATPQRRPDGIRLLIALTDRAPGDTQAHLLLAESLTQENDDANALLEYHTAIRNASPDELGQVEDRLNEMAEKHPDAAYVRQLIGKVQIRQGRYADAVQTLSLALQLSGNQPQYQDDLAKAYVGLGQGQLADGEINAAMASFQRAKDLSPTASQVKEAMARGYLARAERRVQLHAYGDALADYQAAADAMGKVVNRELHAQAASGAYALGLRLQHARIAAGTDIDGEAAAFQIAYNLDSSNLTYKHRLAETRYAQGEQYLADSDYEQAAGAYRRAYELDKSNATYKQAALDAITAWGDQSARILDYDGAVSAYLAAYKLDPLNVGSKQKLADAYTTRGLDYRSQELWKLALADFKEALHLFPDNATYQANYGSVSAWDS